LLRQASDSRLPFSIEIGGKERRIVMSVDPYNSRIKLTRYHGNPLFAASVVLSAAKSFGFGKAIAFVPEKDRKAFNKLFLEEGRIPGYFAGKDAFCMVAYTDSERGMPLDMVNADEILAVAKHKKASNRKVSPFPLRLATAKDCEALAELYDTVFQQSYPTPVSDPEFLEQAIHSNSVFVLMEDGSKLCGAASLEVDKGYGSAEVTDCAVLPGYRGQGILATLVDRLEKEAKHLELTCLYSLSRALQPGINMVLSAAGYRWYGRLVNNCRICGGFEDMNIWQKFISG
jgi:putative beta-lysine N-acetyltransferase